MPSLDQILTSLVSEALSFNGPIVGVALAYAAVRTLQTFSSYSSALRKIRNTPSVKVSDLRSILAFDQVDQSDAKLVFVRGTVEAKSGVLPPQGTKAVLVQRSQLCVFRDWMALFGWRSDDRRKKLLGLPRSDIGAYWKALGRALSQPGSRSLQKFPFILVDGGGGSQKSSSDFVSVNVDGSRHPLPLTTVYRHFHPVDASLYSSVKTLLGHEYPASVLEQVKILPLGKEISAVGLCSFKNGVPEVKSCKDFPYFLSEMSKDQMVVDLTAHTQLLLFTGIVLGSVSIGVLGYFVARNWNRWKMWKQQRRLLQAIRASESNVETQVQGADAEDEVPRHQLCVVCHTSRRQYAFIPCGHLLCCQSCSALVKSHVSPKCLLCQVEILVSVRIYQS
ncbi:E3 ubiquitin-protein ligase SPL2-like isoform X1 [Pyrus communis]|uniref:E3 ubiquitin-protein ligase SPL2-like isoform X1 n=1 Tax=Pyrus communis TaxID=23211 RepID=UPI0035C0BDB8